VLKRPELVREQTERFVSTFLRPHGLEVACTPLLAGAIERAARETAAVPRRESLGTKVFRVVVLPTAVVVNLFSEGGALHISRRPSKKKRTKAKKDKKDKKEKKAKVSSKTVGVQQ